MIVLDTNLLLYLHRTDRPEHRRVTQAVRRAVPRGLATTVINLVEFTCVATSTAKTNRPSSIADCDRFLSDLQAQSGLVVLSPGRDFRERWHESAAEEDVRGRKLHDLAIGVIALSAGVRTLWTHDAGFCAPAGLRVELPLR
ncbi:MAG: PIN domain-containing protein [Deltaproteobacteria bacterium]|nr:PIN domain-containing protein [Deltaproteobacteria bacterium]